MNILKNEDFHFQDISASAVQGVYLKLPEHAMFISLEGIEGCGKSTQAEKLALYLKEHGHPVVLTKEPGGTLLGTNIRKLLLHSKGIRIAGEAELFLFAADRAQHLQEVILPALEAGKIVICDRFTDATVAYQGYARGVDKATVQQLNLLATGGLKPQLTILLDLAAREGLDRVSSRNQQTAPGKGGHDRFEEEGSPFHEQVRQGYLALAAAEPDRIKVVKAKNSVEQVFNDIIARVLPLLKAKRIK